MSDLFDNDFELSGREQQLWSVENEVGPAPQIASRSVADRVRPKDVQVKTEPETAPDLCVELADVTSLPSVPDTVRESALSSCGAQQHPGEILTLEETAAFLRVQESEVLSLIESQKLPARLIGTEWRFLLTAVRSWLHGPDRKGTKP